MRIADDEFVPWPPVDFFAWTFLLVFSSGEFLNRRTGTLGFTFGSLTDLLAWGLVSPDGFGGGGRDIDWGFGCGFGWT